MMPSSTQPTRNESIGTDRESARPAAVRGRVLGLRVHHKHATMNFKIAMLVALVGFVILLGYLASQVRAWEMYLKLAP